MLNKSLSEFKRQHQKKINQVLFVSRKINDDTEILNLIENFLVEKNSFIFESVEKGKIKGRYTIFGKNPELLEMIKLMLKKLSKKNMIGL